MFLVRFWGVRGSIPVPGPSTQRYGGNTTCLEVRVGSEVIIFDAGTGLRDLGNRLLKEQPVHAHMFFSHVHWDHIQGFPFFVPAFVPGNRFDLYGAQKVNRSLEEILAGQMNYPNFPVSLEQMGSRMAFHDIAEGETVAVGEATVDNTMLNHPGGVIAYRISYKNKALVFSTDTEHYSCLDQKLLALARGADVLIYDAMYTPEEYEGTGSTPSRTGWGHSTWVEGVKVAEAAGVKRLVLFHHDPDHDDAKVAEIESAARERFPGSAAAREGLEIDIEGLL